jgi:Dit-like tail protein
MSISIIWTDDAGAVVSCMFDVDEQETHDLQNVVTEHPVETGSDISDNVRPQLRRFTVEGFVTDSPVLSNPGIFNSSAFVSLELQVPEYPFLLSETAIIRAGIGAIGGALFGKPGKPRATLLKLDRSTDSQSRKKAIFDALDDARTNARLCRVFTKLFTYTNMVIEQITVTRAPDDGNGATFTVTLKEVQFVSSDVVDAPEPAEISGAVKNASGSKNTSDDDAKKAALKDSLLSQGLDAAQGLLKKVF